MFEHVGAAHYDEFFAKCRELLTPRRRDAAPHHRQARRRPTAPDPFTDKYIFPGYHLPSLSRRCSAASEKVRLIASDVEILRLHYAYTLRHWLRPRDRKARAKIVALYDERFFRMWEFYLAGGIVLFETGSGCNYQVQYIRDRRALADHPRLYGRGGGALPQDRGRAAPPSQKPRSKTRKRASSARTADMNGARRDERRAASAARFQLQLGAVSRAPSSAPAGAPRASACRHG